MGPFLETLYDVFFSPAAAMRQIAARRPVGQAVAAFFLSVLIPAAAVYFALQAAGFVATPRGLRLRTPAGA